MTPQQIPVPVIESTAQSGENQFGQFRITGQKTEIIPVRVYRYQKSILKRDYEGKASEIVRLLLDKFLNGELPDVEAKLKTGS